MTREEAWNRIDAIIARHEIDDDYVTITSILDYDALRMARKALEQEPCKVSEYDKDHIWYKGWQYISLRRFLEVKAEAEQEPKTGHWIAQDIHNCHTDFKCSECGYIHSFMHLYGKPTADYTYCPNCGAKMKGDTE